MKKLAESSVWAIKYRPKTVSDTVLPSDVSEMILPMVEKKQPMNMILSGTAGIGKTTLAMAIANDLNAEVLFLDGSGKDRGIDTVKNRIQDFATTMSLEGRPKIIIYDEADNLTHDAQLALRSMIERVGRTCNFILTCNFPGRIIDPLHSRCHHFSLQVVGKDAIKEAKKGMALRVVKILNENNVKFTKNAIVSIVSTNFPDMRKVLNDVQRFATADCIDDTVAEKIRQSSSEGLVELLKAKDIKGIIAWVNENITDPVGFVPAFWQSTKDRYSQDTLPYAIVFLNEIQSEIGAVADKHLCLTAGLSKIAIEVEID